MIAIAVGAQIARAEPFWTKPDVRKRMIDDRAVIFSVKTGKSPGGKSTFAVRGAGIVAAPRAFAFRAAQRYERLKEISDRFREVKWDEPTKTLFLAAEALGYQARMILKVDAAKAADRDELKWETTWGRLKGMKGAIGFADVESAGKEKTEIDFASDFSADELPLPRGAMGFALEIVAQKVAERMRSYIEAEWARGPKQTKLN